MTTSARSAICFSGWGEHRDLLSFPTRRSSDLDAVPARADGEVGAVNTLPRESRARQPEGRSEEHTSELQSLRHLVCRLLLEKKKSPSHVVNPPSGLSVF